MHNNYYFLKQLTPVLGEKLQSMLFSTCFSQNKNELVLGFSNEKEEFYIRAVLNPEFCCLTFPEDFIRSKKNSVGLFRNALDLKVVSLQQYLNERCFAIHLEKNYTLLFKMHGNRSNIVLFEDEKVVSIFRNNLKNDLSLKLDQLDRSIIQDFNSFLETGCKTDVLFPTFGKTIIQYLLQQSFYSLSCSEQWEILQSTLNHLNSSQFFICDISSELVFSMVPIGKILHKHEHPIVAVNHFYQLYSGSYYLEKEKNAVKKTLEKKLIQIQNYIKKSSLKLNEIQNNSRNEELANIIMAGLHQLTGESETQELFDFYHNQKVTIKLKRGMAPQKLAENYYRKAKNQKQEINQLMENLEAKEKSLQEIQLQLEEIDTIENIKSLRKFVKEKDIVKANNETEETVPYKEILHEGYQILVGKNAKSNDLLIQKFAKKDDLWLHAKDSSGSHVVIKNKSGQNFPRKVIEKAAEIAAYHSKQRNDSLCPVIYTPRKFVRKVKGAASGAVKVEKENVILVKPSN